MKIFSQSHKFDHSWETVTEAAWKKYPNPMNPNVAGLDVLDRKVDDKGILHTSRLMVTQWGLPDWVTKLVGIDRPCYVSEHSEVDAENKVMKLRSRNLTFCNFVTIDEQLEYRQHPSDKSATLLTQESCISVHGVPLTSYLEGIMHSTCSANAAKGRQAMELVINRIKTEAVDIGRKATAGMEEMMSASQSSSSL